ncbi:MAG: hypothetical protein V4508_19830 [Pseudomonadota bacterium]
MSAPAPSSSLRRLALAALLCAPAWARAGCKRPFNVPVSATGRSVIINGDAVSGIYPELLRSLSGKGGCEFKFSVVPRARQEALFEAGKADLLVPATRSPRRDQLGFFVPLIGSRPTAISVNPALPPLRSIAELMERRELRVALVRGFDYGDAYQAMARELGTQGRLLWEADPTGVARLLNANFADLTVMSPNILAGAVMGDPRVEALGARLRIEALEELPWTEAGVYVSRSSVSAGERAALEHLLGAAAKSGAVYDSFKRYYPPEILNGTIRQR